jgi:tetratricopeptide (TPR) repeat protein
MHTKRQIAQLTFVLVCAINHIHGQVPAQTTTHKVNLYVSVRDAQSAPVSLEMQLWGVDLFTEENRSDHFGNAVFVEVPPGSYRLILRSAVHRQVETEISIPEGESEHFETVRLSGGVSPAPGTTSVAALEVPKRARKLYDAGMLALQHGKWSDARLDFERIIAKFPDFARGYNAFGVSLAELGDTAAAEEAFRHAMKLDTHFGEAYLNLAGLLIDNGRFSECEIISKNLLSFDSRNPESVTKLAIAEYEQQEFDDVIKAVDRVHAAQRPHNPLVHQLSARSYLAKGIEAAAEKEIALFHQESQAVPKKSH